jgi:indolepyruvate ferredoxin oxidoreductase
MTATALSRGDYNLDDRYTAESGEVILDGIQAIVRMMLDLRRLDERHGLDTGVYVSGYQGSPLGGLDKELMRASKLTSPAGIVFHAGLNEELAATAVGGTQKLDQVASARKHAVTGFWYGKSPGLDRAADAIRHANLSGTAVHGGAVALIGDDPASKSSTVPSSCEPMCRSLVVPVLAPGSQAEIVELGLHAVALSRYAGLWTAVKIVADIADGGGTVVAGAAIDAIPELADQAPRVPPVMLPPTNLVAEQDLFTTRLAHVHEYQRLTQLNRVTYEPEHPRIGVVAAGMGYQAVLRALADLGLEQQEFEALGLRLIQLKMPWPLDAGDVRELVSGLDTVLVVEDKLPFVESIVKEALYRAPNPPLVLGKLDAEERPLLPSHSAVAADDVAAALIRILPQDSLPDHALERQAQARAAAEHATSHTLVELPVADAKRTPYFCSGCPHNTSTRAGEDEIVGVGIGCHTMVALDSGDHRRGQLLGMPQMGGEGAQFFGMQHFCDDQHFSQNIGDGTFHHSGSLAIRGAVAAGANITYRLLYNDAVAMTGGQRPEGKMSVPQIARELAAEGVRQVIITTPEPENYEGVELDPIASVRHRDGYQDAADELRQGGGVTVLIHDDRCATEKRRLRKRGKLPKVAERVWINERVCEGCGDCGDVSSCLSVLPVQTDFGRKTRIHQSSCNSDMTCLKGDCPSFVLVTPAASGDTRGGGKRAPSPAGTTVPVQLHETPAPPEHLPEPVMKVGDEVLVRMPGVGGTGVVTVSAILRTAAFLQGLEAAGLDQTGLAQKGGPVVSDLRISHRNVAGQVRASQGGVDVLLGFDLLGCGEPSTLQTLSSKRTVAVLNTDVTPTAAEIVDPLSPAPSVPRLVARVRRASRGDELLAIDAETLSEELFGSHMQTNLLLVGAAYQHGCLPILDVAIERAIELNGTAVAANIAAFRWGRALVADPQALTRALPALHREDPAAEAKSEAAVAAGDPSDPRGEEPLAELIARRAAELVEYQNKAYARRYSDAVQAVAASERTRLGADAHQITRAYANGLFKLMAYKDEYEVARLHLDSIEQARMQAEFGSEAKIQIMLHPPMLKSLGMDQKLKLDAAVATPLFRSLRASRKVRGTRLDPFGRTEMRRLERALIDEYSHLVDDALQHVSADSAGVAADIARLPDMVRGYEDLKLRNVARMRAKAAELIAQLKSA